jgi:8-oxo-dGTP pyrophosphatase MutT (NUDIX family)
MEPRPFDATVAHLRRRLRGELPGTAAQLTMAPAYRSHPDATRVADKSCREAGVLALLFPHEGSTGLLLTVRRDHLKQHAGQVAFPGGRRKSGESLVETALREAEEEINVPPDRVDILGALTPLFIPVSNYCVYPFVGVLAGEPTGLRPLDDEVAHILQVPLSLLMDPAARRSEARLLQDRSVEIPFFAVDGHVVWGATAMMLAELLALVD